MAKLRIKKPPKPLKSKKPEWKGEISREQLDHLLRHILAYALAIKKMQPTEFIPVLQLMTDPSSKNEIGMQLGDGGNTQWGYHKETGVKASLITLNLMDEGKPKSVYQLIVELCHEVIHCHQFYRGDVVPNAAGTINWKGVPYDMTNMASQAWTSQEAYDEYRNSEWEVEAYDHMFPLADAIIDDYMPDGLIQYEGNVVLIESVKNKEL